MDKGERPDKLDAEKLARLARVDPKLLWPLEHRGEASQAHLALIRSREVLIRSRVQLINHVRGTVKSFGGRLPKCSTASFHKKVAVCIPEELRLALEPLLETIASLSARIHHYDRELEALAQEHYPETKLLRQVQGVGTLTALTFVLTLWRTQHASKRVGRWGLTWVWFPAKTSRGSVIHKSASLERVTRCSDGSW
ncbi:MAG: hypothetical protein M3M97_01360 [Actinomycetota bacterium]|nr:hypothetical protein [Actinomycetota bacterium]